ncbi:MAG: NADH-quinone oxidoreductase subunit N [Candidatus Omnitrophica bacterium]|nr:NADH-quinone oxidoreductase subunit N [Candidatus Omnitrophota bacterium]
MTIQFLYPEIILFLLSLVALIAGVTPSLRKFTGVIAFVAVLSALSVLPAASYNSTKAFFGLLQADALSAIFRLLILMGTAFIILLSLGEDKIQQKDTGEYYFFILCLCLSMMLAVSSGNLMMIYIAVEATSIISYILIAFFKNDIFSSEAGLKYFLFGALSTGIMLYGVSMIYGLTGSLNISDIVLALHTGHVHWAAFILALVFILTGISFKCSLAPFYMATPDAYQGAPTPVSLFLSIGPKAMGFALLVRVFFHHPFFIAVHWTKLVEVLAMITMTAGNFIALKQTNVKRLLAYSSIAHAGFILMALSVGSTAGFKAMVFYLFIYVFMNVGAFGSVILCQREDIRQYAGLSRQNPLAALIMAVSLLSLAGLPPLSGFMAKFVVIAVIVHAKMYLLAFIAVFNSVVALFYYLRIVKAMYLSQENVVKPINASVILVMTLVLTVAANIFLGLWPVTLMPHL